MKLIVLIIAAVFISNVQSEVLLRGKSNEISLIDFDGAIKYVDFGNGDRCIYSHLSSQSIKEIGEMHHFIKTVSYVCEEKNRDSNFYLKSFVITDHGLSRELE